MHDIQLDIVSFLTSKPVYILCIISFNIAIELKIVGINLYTTTHPPDHPDK